MVKFLSALLRQKQIEIVRTLSKPFAQLQRRLSTSDNQGLNPKLVVIAEEFSDREKKVTTRVNALFSEVKNADSDSFVPEKEKTASEIISFSDKPKVTSLSLDDAFHVFPLAVEKPEVQLEVPGTLSVPSGYTRYRFEVQYKGTKYYGWLRRELKVGLPTVQEAVEDAMSVACDVDSVEIITSTLTEQGVHCRNLTCHVDLPTSKQLPSSRNILQRCRAWLAKRKDEIAILSFTPCDRNTNLSCRIARPYTVRMFIAF